MKKQFEDLLVWKDARQLVNEIYTLTKKDYFSKDFGLADQIRRSAVSVMSDIAEGFERGSNTELIQFLYVAKGSCGELRTQLIVAFDQKYICKEEMEQTKELAKKVSGMLSNFITFLKHSELKGDKFKKS